ncbi:MAG: transcription termination factor NusA [Candidatus Yanofskybacteria bacterium RIFOXYD1_FULL_44_17]|uniref:Transcription termination/antitermination protein NusA n=1 Tax=Candidatus Yanofskybacteria bacterium GW2011_GWE2_40_11 TaxID=1619033 RepID=A0A0G0TS10_9BACT|nr:MAG: NusA antitermination factor [Candidatus Yanofskybacteria bacterium GW2011_GWE1_40_10]KKR40627.1 MAG: NusA antitermination factor [Candidatus Yanofskybacteria bacterium GW2011_GWE2_40_11]OGN37027.1 MAG: transcription termination factor NusA [Candidatus Yanofskybacteria bacterium RIFOXYA2_FULL_45_28]OGN37034.1 MAG: transcription termination factor NusA [Candidatus Yanofskybacteria bacterium RIFOXYB2_FULL_44_18]OGN37254.1 MAG: transcription termination factor NusA [Candidatus Yanofskybacte
MDTKQFISAIKQIAEEKGIPEGSVLETIEAAIAAAYKRDYGKKGQIVKTKLDVDSGKLEMTQIHYVVEGVDEEGYITGPVPIKVVEEKPDPQDYEGGRDRKRRSHEEANQEDEQKSENGELKIKFNPEKHMLLEDAKNTKPKAAVGDELVTKLETKTDFGRIAAQTAKQVIIQRLREAERDAVYTEFKQREGEIVSGVVQRREGSLVFIDLGKTNGILPPIEQVMGESYRMSQRLRFIILRVEENPRGPVIVLSRAHPRVVYGLFKIEVPEIDSGTVEVRAIAREAGSRTKIAVSSKEEGIDPIGSLVGQKGVRVQTVINELGGEKIDIILWSDKPKELIANSFSPAKVLGVEVVDEERKHALVEVSDDQFSLAIGKRGQNVRLAAKLTGWKIDVRSPKEVVSSDEAEVMPEAGEDRAEAVE